MNKKRIVVIAGGWSKEREISLDSGRAVYDAIDRNRYDVMMCDPLNGLERIMEGRDSIGLAFVLLHGRSGEDGSMQGFLETLGIPYVGSGVLASAMAMNKHKAKQIFRANDIKVADDILVRKDEQVTACNIFKMLGETVVTKPVTEGSSIGMSICRSEEEFDRGFEMAAGHGSEVMIESYIKGREVTCCILGNSKLEALPIVEIAPGEGHLFFDYEAKYTSGVAAEICPARIDEKIAEGVKKIARKAHVALCCKVWSRTDMIIRGDDIFVLETNTIPGMTTNSLFPLAARTGGVPFPQLVEILIELSIE